MFKCESTTLEGTLENTKVKKAGGLSELSKEVPIILNT